MLQEDEEKGDIKDEEGRNQFFLRTKMKSRKWKLEKKKKKRKRVKK